MVRYKCNGVQRLWKLKLSDLGNYVTHNVTWYSTSAMASNVCTVLETQASTEWNRNILEVKGTAPTRFKEIRAKTTVIALASFDVGRLRKISIEKDEQIQCLAVFWQ